MEHNKAVVIFLGILTLFACGVVLQAAQSVVLPLIIAWLLSYILGPVINALVARRIAPGIAATIILLLLLAGCYVLVIFLHARISAFAAAYPSYQAQLERILDSVTENWNMAWNPFEGVDWGEKVGDFLVRMSGSLVAFVSNLVLVFIFLIFLLMGKPFFAYKVHKAFAPDSARNVTNVLASISNQIGRYLAVQFLISLATGVCVWIALTLIGVDFAVTWGAFAFLLNFIPNIGSILASIPPILVALVQHYPGYWPAIITGVALLTIQMGLGNVLAPKIMGDRLNLSPVVVLLSLVFWGWLWGAVGAILSIPIAAAIRIVCENIKPLYPIAVMMGGGRAYRDEFEKGNAPAESA